MTNNQNRTKEINARNRKLVRLCVFRSNRGISASLIDDIKGITMGSVSTLKMESKLSPMEKAAKLGQEIAAMAKSKKIAEVIFDRNNYKYHGKVKALAEAAREYGLKF